MLRQLVTLSADAYSFFTSYTEVDSFNFQSAQYLAIASAGPNAVQLAADAGPLDTLYIAQAYTSLLDNPTALLTRLHASASPWPFSSALMSQMSGILLGYESLVSRDLLNATNVPTIEPGVSISVGPGAALTGATATATSGMARTTVATQSTATLKAMGIPAATGNPQLLIAAAAAAAGVLGVIVL